MFDISNILSLNIESYLALFIAMLIVGPIATLPAAFAATFGTFNIWIVLFLSVLGNVVSNYAYFYIGVWGRETLIEKYGHYIGLNKKRIKKIEYHLHNHAIKTILAIKLLPGTVPMLAIPGAIRMSLKRFTIISVPIIIIESLALIILGYYSGLALSTMITYVKNAQMIFLGFVVVFLVISCILWLYERFIQKELGDII